MNTILVGDAKSRSCIDYRKLQSITIDFMRFPMAIMVVFIHMTPSVTNIEDADYPILSCSGIFNLAGIIFSHVLSHIAVPVFFLISGFLFFANFHKWSFIGYKSKIQSQTRTLLLPYILWNAVPFLLAILVMILGSMIKDWPIENIFSTIKYNSWHIFYDTYEWGTTRVNWLGYNLRMTGPYDLPLWFLRDLIVVIAFTPVIYYMVRKFKFYFLVFLFVAYISRIWILVPGFSITSCFFFSAGAYLALNEINIIKFVHKYSVLIIPTFLVLFCFAVYYDGTNTLTGQNIYPLFICFGVLFAFYLASVCVLKFKIKPNKFLVSNCFFIYAFHCVNLPVIGTVLAASNTFVCRLVPFEDKFGELLSYIITPFVAVAICVLVLKIAYLISPKIAMLFSGNRLGISEKRYLK